MNERIGPLAPEIILAVAAVVALLAGSWLPRGRQWLAGVFAAAACLAVVVVTVATGAGRAAMVFDDSYSIDTATDTVRVISALSAVVVLALASGTLRPAGARPAGARSGAVRSAEARSGAVRADAREAEFYVLVLLATLGAILLAGASDLLLLFAGYLLASIPGYALAGFRKDAPGTEAALKYYLMGALFSVVLLAGITLLYAAGRTTSYPALAAGVSSGGGVAATGVIAVVAGMMFKAGGVPGHFWVPDVTEGTCSPVAAYVTTVPKLGALVALARLLAVAVPVSVVNWPLLIAVLAAASMTLGNLAAFFQTSPRRLLAYSTISQVGYLLMAVAVIDRSELALRSLLFYLTAYAATNLAAFAVIAALPRARVLDDYRGLASRRPGLAAVLVVSLLGLVGTPPAGVFLGKLEVFTATIDGGYTWLAVLAVVNTVASLFYYLRWLAPVFRPAPVAAPPASVAPSGRRPASSSAAVVAYAAGAASLLIGIFGAGILSLVTGQFTG